MDYYSDESIDAQERFLSKLPKYVKKIPDWYLRSLEKGSRSESRTKPYPFLVSRKYLNELFEVQGGQCALTGEPLNFVETAKNGVFQTASLDRIINRFGYLEGNVQWVLKDINFMKGRFSQERVIELSLKIAKNLLKASDEVELLETFQKLEDKEKEHIQESFLEEKRIREDRVISFLRVIENHCTTLKNIKTNRKKRLLILHFPTYYVKWAQTKSLSKEQLLKTIREKSWYHACKPSRLNGKVTRTMMFKVEDTAPDMLKKIFEKLT